MNRGLRRLRDGRPRHRGRAVRAALAAAVAALASVAAVLARRAHRRRSARKVGFDPFLPPEGSSQPPPAPPAAAEAELEPRPRPLADVDWDGLRGRDVLDPAGERIGTLQEVYADVDTSEPEWALVSTGSLRLSLRFVPLRDARLEDGVLHVAFPGATVQAAPQIDADGRISDEEEDRLYDHYGVDRTGALRLPRLT